MPATANRERCHDARVGGHLSGRRLSYDHPGATRPAETTWTSGPPGFRRHKATAPLGRDDDVFEEASEALLRWGVKTRSGFAVHPDQGSDLRVSEGSDYHLAARVGLASVREPVRVVAVVDTTARRGFAHGTLAGHPVSGEEAFVVTLTPDGGVRLVLRSLTRQAPGAWGLAFPALLVAQHWYRARYRRALLSRPVADPVVDGPRARGRGTMPG